KKHRPPAVAAAWQGLPDFALGLQRELRVLWVIFFFRLKAGLRVLRETTLVRVDQLAHFHCIFAVSPVWVHEVNDNYRSEPAKSVNWTCFVHLLFEGFRPDC